MDEPTCRDGTAEGWQVWQDKGDSTMWGGRKGWAPPWTHQLFEGLILLSPYQRYHRSPSLPLPLHPEEIFEKGTFTVDHLDLIHLQIQQRGWCLQTDNTSISWRVNEIRAQICVSFDCNLRVGRGLYLLLIALKFCHDLFVVSASGNGAFLSDTEMWWLIFSPLLKVSLPSPLASLPSFLPSSKVPPGHRLKCLRLRIQQRLVTGPHLLLQVFLLQEKSPRVGGPRISHHCHLQMESTGDFSFIFLQFCHCVPLWMKITPFSVFRMCLKFKENYKHYSILK